VPWHCGGNVGEAAANVISSEATASIDFRLVPNQTPDGVRRRVEQHVERQGYFIVRQPPDEATRLAHPRSPCSPGTRKARIQQRARRSIIRWRSTSLASSSRWLARRSSSHPSLGGSVPMYLFQGDAKTPVIGVPLANFDNNQHAANENLRLQNLWDAIEIFAGLFTAGPDT
jgi:acetylornithine deacetylase/succinyl-diaminopimelate desuccinylase-like protein